MATTTRLQHQLGQHLGLPWPGAGRAGGRGCANQVSGHASWKRAWQAPDCVGNAPASDSSIAAGAGSRLTRQFAAGSMLRQGRRRACAAAAPSDKKAPPELLPRCSSFSADGSNGHNSSTDLEPALSKWLQLGVSALATLVVVAACTVPSATAADALKTCACLLKECRVEFARCLGDVKCASNIACLQTCNGRPDETECQIGCGDLFENSVVDQFNTCAVSEKGCVPQKPDDNTFPIPPPDTLVASFDTTKFTGPWYITSGLNKTFDTFDCQLHEFDATEHTVTGKLSWRIATPDGGFFTRSAIQNFTQDPKQPAVLYNHGNEFLHYQDDWYILDAKTEGAADDFVLVYYRGKNDAWDGYGGAVVYTKSATLPESVLPRLQEATRKVGLNFDRFITTDNSCKPEPPLFARLEKKLENAVVAGEQVLVAKVQEIEKVVEQFGQTELNFLESEFGVLEKDEEFLLQELGDEEKQLLDSLKMGVADVERLFSNALPIRRLR